MMCRRNIVSMLESELYEKIVCGGVEYVFVHAGLDNFNQDKELYEYDLYELISARTDYSKVYYENKILVPGHTPVQKITGGKSTQIYKKNNHMDQLKKCPLDFKQLSSTV